MDTIFRRSWVCTKCGQGLTRKTSARRHNDRLHNGQVTSVRPFEYLVGRLNGRFPPPTDALLFRRQRTLKNSSWHSRINDSTPMIAHNNNSMFNGGDQSNHIPSYHDEPRSSYNPGVRSESEPKPPHNNDNPQKHSETWQKLLEFKLLCDKHYPADYANAYLTWMNMNVNFGQVDILDEKLEWLRRVDQASKLPK